MLNFKMLWPLETRGEQPTKPIWGLSWYFKDLYFKKKKTQLFWILSSTNSIYINVPIYRNTDMPLSWLRPMEMLLLLYLTPKAWVGTEKNWQSCWLSLCRSKTHRCQALNAKQTEKEGEGCEGGCSSLKIHRAWHSLGYTRLSSFFILSYF